MNTTKQTAETHLRTTLCALAFAAAALCPIQSAHAQLVDDFESHTLGSTVGSPWVATDVAAAGQSLNITANQSPFSLGSQAVTYLDGNTVGSNPDLRYTLSTPWASGMSIQFDYMVVANSGNNITMSLQGVDLADDMQLRLRSGGAIRNQATSTTTDFISAIALGTWYHVEIQTSAINPSGLEIFNISVTPFGGATTVVNALTFRNDVNTGYSSIFFTDSSGASATSEFVIDNFSVVVPEPSTFSLLVMALFALAGVRHRFDRRD